MSATVSGRLGRFVIDVDETEPVAVGIGQDDEVRIVREPVPVDAPGPERDQARRLRFLLDGPMHMQVEVRARVILRRRLAGRCSV